MAEGGGGVLVGKRVRDEVASTVPSPCSLGSGVPDVSPVSGVSMIVTQAGGGVSVAVGNSVGVMLGSWVCVGRGVIDAMGRNVALGTGVVVGISVGLAQPVKSSRLVKITT